LNPACPECEDRVRDWGGEIALMGGEHDCSVSGAKFGQKLDHLAYALDVHIGEGFVEQQQASDVL
jgi:hypothetical protein